MPETNVSAASIESIRYSPLKYESRDVEPHRISQFAFCLQPIIDIVAAFSAAFLVAFEGATGDIAVGHGCRQSIWHNGRHGYDFRASSSIWLLHDVFYIFQGPRCDRTDFAGKSTGRTVLRQK